MKHLSEAEITRVKKAQKAHQALSASTAQEHEAAMRLNLATTSDEVTTKDVGSREKRLVVILEG